MREYSCLTLLALTIALLWGVPVYAQAANERDLMRAGALPAESTRRVALVIGVSDYESEEVDDLEYADIDAVSLHNALIQYGNFKAEDIRILVTTPNMKNSDGPPTRHNIATQLNWLSLQQADEVLVFYSGHGVTIGDEVYILPQDADRTTAEDMGIPITKLAKAAQGSQALRWMLFVDACRTSLEAGSKSLPTMGVIADEYITINGGITLYSARIGQPSWEYDELGHGVFTAAILEGLEGGADRDKNQVITASELHLYIAEYMQERVRVHGGHPQEPRMDNKEMAAGEFPLFFLGDEPARPPRALLALREGYLPIPPPSGAPMRGRGAEGVDPARPLAMTGGVLGIGALGAGIAFLGTAQVAFILDNQGLDSALAQDLSRDAGVAALGLGAGSLVFLGAGTLAWVF